MAALAATAVVAAAQPAAAQPAPELPRWVQAAPAFAPLAPRLADRPAVLLETDYYVYGPGTNFDEPEVTVSIDANSHDGPATLYLFWEDRGNGQRQYYNVATGFGNAAVDLFGTAGSPALVRVPELTDFRLFGAGSAFGSLPNTVPRTTGLYQLVLEIRDAAGAQAIARSNAMYNFVDGVVPVSGVIAGGDWTADNAYFLAAPVHVTSGTLNIQAGTVVLGGNAGEGTLVIRQGAQINAVGTAERPIVFTSEFPVGERAAGNWGGLVINGSAPVNVPNPTGEGDSGPYGGDDPNDSSGRLSYVRVEYAGIRFSDQNELNGIALQGVGRGTRLDHLQVHFNQDDGIEFFGGTADARHVLITGAEDDSLDWTFGWNGRLQHFVAIQRNPSGDSGVEADNDETDPNLLPRSNPTIFNATWVGNRRVPGGESGRGLLFRRGTHVTLKNFVVESFTGLCLEVDGADSEAAVGAGIDVSHGFLSDCAAGSSDVQEYLQGQPNVFFAAALLADPFALTGDVTPLSPQARDAGSAAAPPADGFFDNVNYVGGVNPNDPWIWEGWTTWSDN
ncbi:MAG TPA: hypothetical protein VHM02_09355 [Thermoanaerobaculia bacterium]|nr:hypothetical protein [Thermoanaerobaculia bacterium]